MTTNPAPLPELVQDLEIEGTTFQDGITIHAKRLGRLRRIEKWQPLKILGSGGYGVVWLEHRVKGGIAAQPFYRAVKVFRTHGRGPRHYVGELEALAKFTQHKHSDYFVEFLGWYENPKSGCLHIAMEYCPHGDLKSYLKEHVGRLPEDDVKDIMSQVLAGIAMMHRADFANGDIKPANILIKSKPPDGHWWVKICDLGLSERAKGHSASATTTVKGTPEFMPPEMRRRSAGPGRIDGFMVDMWCFGETVFQALTGEPVFKGDAAVACYSEGSLGFPVQALHRVNASSQAISFIKSLMKADPHERMTSEQANNCLWIITINEVIYVPEGPPMIAMLTPPSGQWSNTLTFLHRPVLQQQGGFQSENPPSLRIIAELQPVRPPYSGLTLRGGNLDVVHPNTSNGQGPDAQPKPVHRGSRASVATSRTRIIHPDFLISRAPQPSPHSGHSHFGRNLHPHIDAPTDLYVIQPHPPRKRMCNHRPGRFLAPRCPGEVSSTWEDEAKIKDIAAHFQCLERKAEGLHKGKPTTGQRTKFEELKEYAETFKLYPVLDRVDRRVLELESM